MAHPISDAALSPLGHKPPLCKVRRKETASRRARFGTAPYLETPSVIVGTDALEVQSSFRLQTHGGRREPADVSAGPTGGGSAIVRTAASDVAHVAAWE